jgi:uncharacterized lipoprotein YmbA
MTRLLKIMVTVGTLALGLSGCAGAPTRFYTLDAAPHAQAGGGFAYVGPPFRIDAVHIPPAYDRIELVRETSPNRFTVSDNDHWAAPLDELLRRVLTQGLAARLPGGKVIFPDTPKSPDASGMVIDILALSTSSQGVVMDVSWALASARPVVTNAPAATLERHTLRLTAPTVGGVGGDAAEISSLADELAAAIAGDLATRGL